MAIAAATSTLRSAVTFLSDIPKRDLLILTSCATCLGSAFYGNSVFQMIGPFSLYLATRSKEPSDRPMQYFTTKMNLAFSSILLTKRLLEGSNAVEATFALTHATASIIEYANMHFAIKGKFPFEGFGRSLLERCSKTFLYVK